MNRQATIVLSVFILAGCTKPGIVNLGLECPEWKAEWIEAPATFEGAPEFSSTLILDARVKKATAYFCGLGFGELFINSQKVGNDLLSPSYTSYNRRDSLEFTPDAFAPDRSRGFHTQYLSYDVTGLLHKGENEVSALVGGGFYSSRFYGKYPAYGTRKMLCQIDIEYANGKTLSFVSDSSWNVRQSKIVLDGIFEGEIYDARREASREKARVAQSPETQLVPQTSPTDKVMEVLPPKSIEKLEDGSVRVDFGQYICGWVRLKGIGSKEGDVIEIIPECETRGNGVCKFISDGKTSSYAPRFTWYAFRTAVIKGWDGELGPENIEAEAVYSDMATTASFECSDPVLTAIHRAWWRTQTDNFHLGGASDCPHRERRPYTGDGEASCASVMSTFDAAEFYRKWLRDMRDVQDTLTGYIPNTAPFLGGGGGVPWGSAICIMSWEHYLHYGDPSILEENFFAMKEYLGHLSAWTLPDGTVFQKMTRPGESEPYYWHNLGEWSPPYNLPAENLIHTWYFWRCASIISSAAKVLGLTEDEREYAAVRDAAAEAFHAKFWDEAAGSYGAGSGILGENGYGTGCAEGVGDGSNVFALAMGVPEERLERVLDTVKKEFEANDGHFNTGIYGLSILGEALCRYGLDEYVFEAMTKTDFPSFGYMLAQGSDTLWEQWNGEESHNHPMFGGSLMWAYRCLAGVKPDLSDPHHTIVAPRPAGNLSWLRYSTVTPSGKICVDWNVSDGEFTLRLKAPRKAHVTVQMPDGGDAFEARGGGVWKCKLTSNS